MDNFKLAKDPSQDQRALASRGAYLLEQNAGYVLIFAGVAFAVIAALSDSVAVAVVFAGFGAVMIILGCFSSRIEGDIEATKDGVRAVVREIERVAHENEIPKDALLDATLNRVWASNSSLYDRWVSSAQHAARAAAEEAAPTVLHAVERHYQRAEAFSQWLRENGWEIVETGIRDSVIGRKDDELLVADVLGFTEEAGTPVDLSPLSPRHLRFALSLLDDYRDLYPVRRPALVIPAGMPVSEAASKEASAHEMSLYAVDDSGKVELLNPLPRQ